MVFVCRLHKVIEAIKIIPTGIEASIQLMQHLIDFLHEELRGLLLFHVHSHMITYVPVCP
jgi:hypothetical protein